MKPYSLVLIGGDARRAEIKNWLRERSDIAVVGEINTASGLRLVASLAPDIVVLDCAVPAINALAALPWLHALPCAQHVVALGASGCPAEQRLMLELGAVAYAAPQGKAAFMRALALVEKLAALAGRSAAPGHTFDMLHPAT
jgi:DNA-binding NarL/FixJ family response regulator